MASIGGHQTSLNPGMASSAAYQNQPTDQSNVKSKEYYVKIPK